MYKISLACSLIDALLVVLCIQILFSPSPCQQIQIEANDPNLFKDLSKL